jgi:hypothetical protein
VLGVSAKLEQCAGTLKYGLLLAASHTYLIFYSADFAGGFVELSRDGRIDHFSPNNVACNEI